MWAWICSMTTVASNTASAAVLIPLESAKVLRFQVTVASRSTRAVSMEVHDGTVVGV
jgi:hypothetical protein